MSKWRKMQPFKQRQFCKSWINVFQYNIDALEFLYAWNNPGNIK